MIKILMLVSCSQSSFSESGPARVTDIFLDGSRLIL